MSKWHERTSRFEATGPKSYVTGPKIPLNALTPKQLLEIRALNGISSSTHTHFFNDYDDVTANLKYDPKYYDDEEKYEK